MVYRKHIADSANMEQLAIHVIPNYFLETSSGVTTGTSTGSGANVFVQRQTLWPPLELATDLMSSCNVYTLGQVLIKVLCSNFTYTVILCSLSSFYWSSIHAGFQVDAGKFFIFFLTVALTSIAAASIAFAVSSLANVTGIATVVVGLSLILSMVSESDSVIYIVHCIHVCTAISQQCFPLKCMHM